MHRNSTVGSAYACPLFPVKRESYGLQHCLAHGEPASEPQLGGSQEGPGWIPAATAPNLSHDGTVDV